jgi:erythritol transport system substrate-binding protein
MCVIVPEVENPYYGVQQEFAARKAEELGYAVLKLVHGDDHAKESELIDLCVARQAVAIILNPADNARSIAAIQRAKEAGVPAFVIDRHIMHQGVAVSQIFANREQGAIVLAEEFARLMGEEGEFFETIVNSRIMDIRDQVLDRMPGMKVVAWPRTDGSVTDAYKVIQGQLPAHPDVKGIICPTGRTTLGAQAAVHAAGRSDVIVVGLGGSDDVIQSIMSGEIDAGVLPPVTELATQAVVQADRYFCTGSTGSPDERQYLDMILLTPENACTYTAFVPNGKTGCP